MPYKLAQQLLNQYTTASQKIRIFLYWENILILDSLRRLCKHVLRIYYFNFENYGLQLKSEFFTLTL